MGDCRSVMPSPTRWPVRDLASLGVQRPVLSRVRDPRGRSGLAAPGELGCAGPLRPRVRVSPAPYPAAAAPGK